MYVCIYVYVCQYVCMCVCMPVPVSLSLIISVVFNNKTVKKICSPRSKINHLFLPSSVLPLGSIPAFCVNGNGYLICRLDIELHPDV